ASASATVLSAAFRFIRLAQENTVCCRLAPYRLVSVLLSISIVEGGTMVGLNSALDSAMFDLSLVQEPVPLSCGSRAAHACGRASRCASRLASAARIWGSLWVASW